MSLTEERKKFILKISFGEEKNLNKVEIYNKKSQASLLVKKTESIGTKTRMPEC